MNKFPTISHRLLKIFRRLMPMMLSSIWRLSVDKPIARFDVRLLVCGKKWKCDGRVFLQRL